MALCVCLYVCFCVCQEQELLLFFSCNISLTVKALRLAQRVLLRNQIMLKDVDIRIIILQMKLIVILMFIAIVCVSGEEQRTIGKEKFELTEDVNNTRSLIPAGYGINPYSSDEGLRGKYAKDNYLDQIASSTKDVDTVEKSPSRNLSPAIETSTVKPGSACYVILIDR